ncbi:MAG: ABC transporter permease [Actinobacteria bacterium]|nr:ABC transporter permease [Actinomycetota bacterium]
MRVFSIGLVISGIHLSMPLLFAAYGGLVSERSGVINIALEGMMLFGAFLGVAVTFWTGSPWLGLAAGVGLGILLGALHGLLSITVRADQIVSATAINLLALGVTAALIPTIWGQPGVSPTVARIPPVVLPGLSDLPLVGEIFAELSILDYVGFLMVPVAFYVLYRTPLGLRLRACGEVPEAAASTGVDVIRTRYLAVLTSGALAALGGVYLSLVQVGLFQRGMTQGRGFIALAAMIFGKWRPLPILAASLLLGFADAFQFRAQAVGLPLPHDLLLALPYLVALVALATFIGRATAPGAIGKPYVKD